MKSLINVADPRVKMIISEVENKSKIALDLPQIVESAVLPIYALIKSHHKIKNKPEQIASGVLVHIKDEFFIFSASHVFDLIGEYQLLVGAGDGSILQSLGGDRLAAKKEIPAHTKMTL